MESGSTGDQAINHSDLISDKTGCQKCLSLSEQCASELNASRHSGKYRQLCFLALVEEHHLLYCPCVAV